MNIPKAVIFDCDGVLVDSEPITNAIIQENLAARGLVLTMQEIIDLFVGGTMAAVGERAAEMGATVEPDWLQSMYATMYAQLAQGTPIVTGVVDVLDLLDRAGIIYGVGSNGPPEKMNVTLGQHPDLYRRLEGRLFSSHVHAKPKPAPDLYLYAARAMGVSPSDCVVIDDSPSGCMGAINAGIRCLGYAEHTDGVALRRIGAEVFHDMADLPGLLGLNG